MVHVAAAAVRGNNMALRSEFGRSRESVLRQRINQGKAKAYQDAKRRALLVTEMSVEVNAELVREAEQRKLKKLTMIEEKQAERRRIQEDEARREAELEELVAADAKVGVRARTRPLWSCTSMCVRACVCGSVTCMCCLLGGTGQAGAAARARAHCVDRRPP